MPAARMPSVSAPASAGPDRRPSRPTAIARWPRATASEPTAWPIARTAAGVNTVSTMPRMS